MSAHLPFSDPPHNTIIEEECEFLNPPIDDPLLPLYQEIPLSVPSQMINNTGEETSNIRLTNYEDVGIEKQQDLTAPQRVVLRSMRNRDQNAAMAKEGPSCSSPAAKKLDHNARERIRRMKLNASFLALRALLPNSRRSKKRWSAPAIVDKVLKYIPELENEVEKLKSKKLENLQLSAAKRNKISNGNTEDDPSSQTSVSVNKVNGEEAIVQICMAKEDHGLLAFTNLLRSVEDEGIFIKSASMSQVCDTRICYHLHIQINQSSAGAHCIEELKEKIIPWLRK